MREKSELEKTVEFALRGAPEIKGDEKRQWLGEFRERVILGLTPEQTQKMEAHSYVREALGDPQAEILIVNNNIPMEVTSKYMQLAKEVNKEYKSVATEYSQAMGLVVASRQAVNRGEVTVEIKELPQKFKGAKHKNLCGECYKELESIAPQYASQFKKQTLMDKMLGIKCGACEQHGDSGPLI